jgi:hypothetical protein
MRLLHNYCIGVQQAERLLLDHYNDVDMYTRIGILDTAWQAIGIAYLITCSKGSFYIDVKCKSLIPRKRQGHQNARN